MKRLLCLLFLAAAGLVAQTPDCVIPFTFNAVGQRSAITGCGRNQQGVFEWRVIYGNNGFATLSLRLESTRDLAGVPSTWVAFVGTLVSGINPNTSTTQASTDMTGFNQFVSVTLTSATGAGTITGVLYGCREPGCSIAGSSITAVIPTPVPVDGPTAAGAAPTTPPVLVAGQDGAPGLIRTIKTDANGSLIPSNASSADADAISNMQEAPTGAAGGVLYPRVFNRVFNGTTWDRMRGNTTGVSPSNASSANADAVANTQLNPTDAAGTNIFARYFAYLFNGTTWDRLRGNTTGLSPSNASSADADAVVNTQLTPTDSASAIIYARVFNKVFNGTTWDRMRGNTSGMAPTNASSALADALSNTELNWTDAAGANLFGRGFGHWYNGTTWDRGRTASLANDPAATTLTARNSIGAPLVEFGSRWVVNSSPATSSQGTASIAAEASVRHVADSVCFSAQAAGAVTATAITVTIRDGATGAGTVLRTFQVAIPVAAATGQQEVAPFCTPTGMGLVGTTATAMTAEFSAGVTNVNQSISITGYNVN